MKNLFLILFIVSIFSCSKHLEKASSFEINGNLIEVRQDFLKFESLENFYAIVDDYYQHDELYFTFFQNHRPIENSLIAYDDFMTLFESREWEDKGEVLKYIDKHVAGVKYKDDELQNLFRMDYKNLFCNLDGIIQIGDYIYKYSDEGRYKMEASSIVNDFDFSDADFKVSSIHSKHKIIDLRSDFAGGCLDEVASRRIKCSNTLDFGAYESPGCSFPQGFNSVLIAEAKIKFQKKAWIGWINARADLLRIDIGFEAFDSNGNKVLEIVDLRESTNAYNTKWASIDSFCANCSLNYSFTDYEFDFRGELGLTVYACEHDLFLNVNDTNLCP